MNKITRREFLKASSLTVASLALASCSQQVQPTTTPVAGSTGEPEGKVIIWGWEPEDLGVKALIPGFQKKYPKVQVEFVIVPWSDIHTKVTAAIQAGTGGPDLCCIEGYLVPQFHEVAVDLTDKMTPYRPQIAMAKFNEIETQDGRLVAFPADCPPGALIWREDVFRELGLTELPTQWEEFLRVVAPKVTIPDKRYLFGMDGEYMPGFYWWRPLAAQQDSGYFNKAGKVVFDSPEGIRVTQWMYDAVTTYACTAKGYPYWEGAAWWPAIKDSRVVASIAAPWMVSLLKQQAPEHSGKWKAAPMPVFEASNHKSGLLGGNSYIIPKTSTNKELAWLFGEYVYLTVEGNLGRYNAMGHWPSILDTFKDPIFEQSDDYFGGQKLGRLFGDLTKDVNGVPYTKNFGEVNDKVVEPTLFKIFDNQVTVEAGMKAAAEEMRAMSQ